MPPTRHWRAVGTLDFIDNTERVVFYVVVGAEIVRTHSRTVGDLVKKINEQIEIGACYRVYAEVEKHLRNTNKSLEWYLKAIYLFQLIDSRYELLVMRYLAAISDMLDNNTRTAMLYLARECFMQEGVTHYVGRISAATRQTSSKGCFGSLFTSMRRRR